MATVRKLHSLIITGPIGNAVVEITAGWAIVLVATGIYLWWPRGGSPTVGLRGRPAGRIFWRDLHASTGIVAGGLIAFLALTGLPWSGVWGQGLQGLVAERALGRPKPPAATSQESQEGHGSQHGGASVLPWSMERAAVPHGGIERIGPDRAIAAAKARGIGPAWTLTFPRDPSAPYQISAMIVRADDAHVVYVDAASGRVLQDARYAAFGDGAQAIEWGIATHQGQQYGEINRLLMLGACACMLLLVVTAPVMWWKRRPKGRIGAPPGRSGPGLLAIMAVGGVLFPLTGLTMVVALLGEAAVRAVRARSVTTA